MNNIKIDSYFSDVISKDINTILESFKQDEIYNLGDIVKRIVRDNELIRIYILDIHSGGVAIIKTLGKERYTIITLSEDDGDFFPGVISCNNKVSFIYLMSEAISLLNNTLV